MPAPCFPSDPHIKASPIMVVKDTLQRVRSKRRMSKGEGETLAAHKIKNLQLLTIVSRGTRIEDLRYPCFTIAHKSHIHNLLEGMYFRKSHRHLGLALLLQLHIFSGMRV